MRNEFRTSQGIVPFGVGAIVDFVDDTLMMAGLDAWPTEVNSSNQALQEACRVIDGRLAGRLSITMGRRITHFLSPALAPEIGRFTGSPRMDRDLMPFVRFPNWYYCPRCRCMKHIAWNTRSGAEQLRCDNPNRLRAGGAQPCDKLYKKRRPKLIPVRFVVACEAGHIADFPWDAWAHRGVDCAEGHPELYFTSTTLPGVAGIQIECRKCCARRSLAGAFKREELSKIKPDGCNGQRPWFGPSGDEVCTEDLQTIQRGASNAYFADIARSILIPPHSTKIHQVLENQKIRDLIESWLPDLHRPSLKVLAEYNRIDPEDFIAAVEDRYVKDAGGQSGAAADETSYRRQEFDAFAGPRPPQEERRDFDLRSIDVSEYGTWFAKHFEAVALVPRLRETRVLTGFSRLIPPGANRHPAAQLALGKTNWLPGVSVRGEGIFLRFRRERLNDWAQNAQVCARIERIRQNLAGVPERSRRFHDSPTPKLIMIHTMSHLLIRQLAFECGYDASSIQERLYVSTEPDGMAGVLLYTASGDSEGTLGGLVRRGKPDFLEATIRAALVNADICSSDPLCIESEGQGLSSLNLAACHACSLLPETSCEMSNMLLDRGLVTGLPDDPEVGYFVR